MSKYGIDLDGKKPDNMDATPAAAVAAVAVAAEEKPDSGEASATPTPAQEAQTTQTVDSADKLEEYSNPKPPTRNPEKSVKVKLNMPDGSFSTVLIGPNCTVAEVCGTVAFRRGYNPLVLYTITTLANSEGHFEGTQAELKPGGVPMLPILRNACEHGMEIEVRELYDKEDKMQAAAVGYQISEDA